MISIIIPTLNEEKLLPKLLASIKKQKYVDYEIIVSDNHSTDNTRKIAKEHGCKVVDGGLPGKARNEGAKVAKGDFLFFFDADVILPSLFLKKCLDEMKLKKVSIATTLVQPNSTYYFDALMFKVSGFYQKITQSFEPRAAGFCIIIDKFIFNKLNGFDETLKLCEDHDLVKRASYLGSFKVLTSCKIIISMRRFDKEGRLKTMFKYIVIDTSRVFGIQHDFEYKFDHYDK